MPTTTTTLSLCSIFFFIVLLVFPSCTHSIYNNINANKNNFIQVGKLKLSPIGLGTWSWGNRFLWQYDTSQDPLLYETYQYCIQNGINWFDTADSYGTGQLSGRSEELLGQFKQQSSSSLSSTTAKRKTIFGSWPTSSASATTPSNANSNSNPYIITKLAPYPWRLGTQSMITAAKESSKRLQKPIDILQLHWPPSLQWQEKEYLQAFSQVVEAGGATQIGLSNYGPKSLRRVCSILDQYQQQPYSNQVIIIVYVY